MTGTLRQLPLYQLQLIQTSAANLDWENGIHTPDSRMTCPVAYEKAGNTANTTFIAKETTFSFFLDLITASHVLYDCI